MGRVLLKFRHEERPFGIPITLFAANSAAPIMTVMPSWLRRARSPTKKLHLFTSDNFVYPDVPIFLILSITLLVRERNVALVAMERSLHN